MVELITAIICLVIVGGSFALFGIWGPLAILLVFYLNEIRYRLKHGHWRPNQRPF